MGKSSKLEAAAADLANPEVTKKKKSKKSKTEATQEPEFPTVEKKAHKRKRDTVPSAVDPDEEEASSSKKKKKGKHAESAEKSSSEKKEKKEKKREKKRRERNQDVAVSPEGETAADSPKKAKKTKKQHKEEVVSEMSSSEEDDAQAVKAAIVQRKAEKAKRKAEKEKKHRGEDIEEPVPALASGVADPKKKKSAKNDTPAVPRETTAPVPAEDLAERWNVQELGGGSSRQSKFMRLLGAKKVGADVTAIPAAGAKGAVGSARPKFDINNVSNDLEKQFETGVRMKFEAGAKRRGLGA
ncbi:small acidic protein family-domain-containing protein [Lasiosphaeria hispida]|uniref:Small acidic protein n=1 Tax=Lasiosphaeria hispida TaxID=260671 RepID=A0AAJ0HPS8_9PEZI|nr:small acidic protein family-domain-containing protein [Lasiosphaeria hispida]